MVNIALSPWTNYTFHVTAKNSIGMSDKSGFTQTMCKTSEDIPFRSPSGVCTESREPDQLVIVWDVSSILIQVHMYIYYQFNDYIYLLKYKQSLFLL